MEYLVCVILGLVIGITSAFFGLGGGVILVPVLPAFFAMDALQAKTTSLLTIFLLVSFNTFNFLKQKRIDFKAGWIMGLLSAGFAYLSADWAYGIPDRYIWYAMFILLLALTIKVLYSKDKATLKEKFKTPALLALGSLAGITSGCLGVGSGLLASPLMLSLKIVKPEQVSPTANFVMVFTTVFALLGYFINVNHLAWPYFGLARVDYALILFGSSLITATFGKKHQHNLSPKLRRQILGGMLLLLALKTLQSAISSSI